MTIWKIFLLLLAEAVGLSEKKILQAVIQPTKLIFISKLQAHNYYRVHIQAAK